LYRDSVHDVADRICEYGSKNWNIRVTIVEIRTLLEWDRLLKFRAIVKGYPGRTVYTMMGGFAPCRYGQDWERGRNS
jgi:hypothetical protein